MKLGSLLPFFGPLNPNYSARGVGLKWMWGIEIYPACVSSKLQVSSNCTNVHFAWKHI